MKFSGEKTAYAYQRRERNAYDLMRERLGPINDYIISDINSTNILDGSSSVRKHWR
jgi:hypothetical protein